MMIRLPGVLLATMLFSFTESHQNLLSKSNFARTYYQKDTTIRLLETYWRLVELNGNEVKPPRQEKDEIYLVMMKAGNRLEGFAGCNQIGGTYELDGSRLNFANVIGTMVSCPDTEIENLFLDALKTVDSYKISDNTLLLNKEGVVLARFRQSPLTRRGQPAR